ncbi:YihY/virulence factor BrkB family protein [Undibacterium sp. Di27W]|uniref:YihY/virulence factor BrkB family protein n=1 Tax=Undibacterium sp. Di27W TaxID=3413036 RepID=UPI003BF34701
MLKRGIALPRLLPGLLHNLLSILQNSVLEWLRHRAASKGAALAFYTLFSLAPILVLVLAIAGFFYGAQAARGQLFGQLQSLVGQSSASAIQALLAGARDAEQSRIATMVASILLLVGATSVFAELKASLDEIWQVPPQEGNSIWFLIRTRLLSFGLILVLAFLMLVSLVINAVLTALEYYWGGSKLALALVFLPLSSLLGFAVITVLFAVIFKMLPQVRLPWSDVWVGAAGTSALFHAGKYVIGVYIGNSGVASSFGAAGSMIAILLWVYYSAQIFLLGAEFTRQYAYKLGSLRHTEKLQDK